MRGIGVDIIEIERIRNTLENTKGAFLDKFLTPAEKAYCLTFKDPAPQVAGRFAAKEAIAKALGCGFGEELSFEDLEILNDEKGKPIARLAPNANSRFNSPNIQLSISHCKSHAVAFATVED